MNDNMKLFAVLLGGRAADANVELHDIVFAVGENIESTFPSLTAKWFGIDDGLHIDAHKQLDIVDGHTVTLSQTKPESKQPLIHCVNFGGYIPKFFGEKHEVEFLVGRNKNDIIQRAKKDLCVNTHLQHCDNNITIGGTDTDRRVDDIISVGCVDGYYIQLTPTTTQSKTDVIADYCRIVAQV